MIAGAIETSASLAGVVATARMMPLKADCRRVDCPREYGPHKTIYNRFCRWSEKGAWQKIFESVAGPSEPPEQAALESSHVKVHRCASGGGRIFRRSGLRKAAATAKSTRSWTSSAALGVDSRPRHSPVVGRPKNASVSSLRGLCPQSPLRPASKNFSPTPSAGSGGDDTDAIGAFLKARGIKPVFPGKSNRKKKIRHAKRHAKKAYKNRNDVERCFGRLKDFRRIATP
jgi:transposase